MTWFNQNNSERRSKYNLCKTSGLPREMCCRLRDWRWSTLQGAIDIYVAVFIRKDPAILKDLAEYHNVTILPK